MTRTGVTPVVAVVILLMMTVAASGGAYAWMMQVQQDAQRAGGSDLHTDIDVKDTICESGAVRLALKNSGDVQVQARDTAVYVYGPDGHLNATRNGIDFSWAAFTEPGGFDQVGVLLPQPQDVGQFYTVEVSFPHSDHTVETSCRVERNALPGAVGGYDAASEYTHTVELQASGNSADDMTHGYWIDGSTVFTQGRSYGFLALDRDTGTVVQTDTFDVYGTAAEAGNLAGNMSTYGSDHLLLINTHDEPQNNRLSNGLPTEMNATGATEQFSGGPSTFYYRSAYQLVGYQGLGVDGGIEYYAGDEDRDPDAHLTTVLHLVDGNIGLNSTYR